MTADSMPENLPSQNFEPRIYGVGAWTDHIYFAYDLIAKLRPQLLVELGVDRGESYFAFCQAAEENQADTRCCGIDTWRGDSHAGEYDETTFAQVTEHNRAHYENFSTLLRMDFNSALDKFANESIDVLHLDGWHTEGAARHDVDAWLPKIRPSGIFLLHDVEMRQRDFGVWKVWQEFAQRGRSFVLQDGPGLGVWEKPPRAKQPALLENLFAGDAEALALKNYYSHCAAELRAQIAEQWRDGSIRSTPFARQTVLQIFHSTDGMHREESSVYGRLGHNEWKTVVMELPQGAGAKPLRIDFVSAFTTIEIAALRVRVGSQTLFAAPEKNSFESIRAAGDLEICGTEPHFRFRVTGIDPQLYLPALDGSLADNDRLTVELRLKVVAA